MGFYSQIVFPRLCDFLLDQPLVADHRRQLLSTTQGEVLEIGFGTGLNLPHYPENVGKITAIDPSAGMHRLAERRIQEARIAVDYKLASGDRLPLDASRFDCVVSTFTLCSVAEPTRTLSEVFRVLKPGGRFLFFEHGQSPEPAVERWQKRLNWLQMRLGDGCRLDRNIKEIVAGEPFARVELTEFYLEKSPKTHGYIYRGIATK